MMRYRFLVPVLAVAAAVIWPTAAPAQSRAPYLQNGSADAMTVVWRSDASEPTRVCYGSSPDDLTETAGDGAAETEHVVRIEGLDPATRYYYAVGTDGCPPAEDGDSGRYFETAPETGEAVPFRFWAVGDSGTGDSDQAAVRDAMLQTVGEREPDLFLHLGDMAYDVGTTDEFTQNFFGMYESILDSTVTWPTIGNHEAQTSDSSSESGPYYDSYVLPTEGEAGGVASGTEAYYSYDYANAHFIVLDSYETSRDPDDAMLRWLKSDLEATDQQWIVAYWHHPPYSKGTHDSDTEGHLIDMRENVLPILEARGVDLVLAGHSHIYERSHLLSGAYETPTGADGNIVDQGDGKLDGDGAYQSAGERALYVVAGHGGISTGGPGNHPLMYFTEAENGSCIVDVDGETMQLRNIRHDGSITDRVTLVKSDGLSLLAPVAGDEHLAGSTVDISWISEDQSGSVDLAYSLDGGANWQSIAEDLEDDGLHEWKSPKRLSDEVRIRITDASDPNVTDTSGDFRLVRTASKQIIRFGDVWEYNDSGEDLGTGWRTEYGEWDRGPGQLGYGDGDEETVLEDEDPNVPSVCFRHQFQVEQGYEVVGANLRVLFDDGFAAWINGQQVTSRNVDDVGFGAYASGASDENEIAETELDVSGDNPFQEGENILAVMVKQRSGGSSDVSFDLAMELQLRVSDLDAPPAEDAGMDTSESVADEAAAEPGDGGGEPEGGDDGQTSDTDQSDDGGPVDADGTVIRGRGSCACRATDPTSRPGLALVLFAILVIGGRRFFGRD